MTVKQIKRYGARRDTPDHRDILFHLQHPIDLDQPLPLTVDLRSQFSACYDQGQLGSCTGNGWAGVLEYTLNKENESIGTPSRLFIYSNELQKDGQSAPFPDAGSEIRTGAAVIASYGCPPESEWPYSDANPGPFQELPPQNIYSDAAKHHSLVYQRIMVGVPGRPMRSALAQGFPIVFGFSVPSFFEGGWDPASSPLPVPQPSDQIIGGHCVVIVGYDFSRKTFNDPAFLCRNSWGPNWGMSGYFWMDYRYFSGSNPLANDLWILEKAA